MYNKDIKYNKPSEEKKKRKNRSRKITWFNPPYSADVKTNVGAKFLKLMRKHFPKEHKLHQIFNKNTLKVSYSCMENMNAVIKSHNQKVIRQATNRPCDEEPQTNCNCRNKPQCPLQGRCLDRAIVYKATIQHGNAEKAYYGLAGGPFKDRYRNHVKSFKHEKYKNETQLSKYVWDLKETNTQYTLSWEIAKKSNTNVRRSGSCNLCLEEKLLIITNKAAINKRSEILSKCRHRNRPPRKPPKRQTDPTRHTK